MRSVQLEADDAVRGHTVIIYPTAEADVRVRQKRLDGPLRDILVQVTFAGVKHNSYLATTDVSANGRDAAG